MNWDQETARRIGFIEQAIPPTLPFQLDQGRMVTGPAGFWAAILSDIARGPQGARARTGALQKDLVLLEEKLRCANDAKPSKGP